MTNIRETIEQLIEYAQGAPGKNLARLEARDAILAAIDKDVIGANELGEWRGKPRMTVKAEARNHLRAEQRTKLYKEAKK